MKKAKIFLSALTVLAVVGSALAFKAKTGNIFAKVCNTSLHQCLIDTFHAQETTVSGATNANYDVLGAPCKPGNICRSKTVFDN